MGPTHEATNPKNNVLAKQTSQNHQGAENLSCCMIRKYLHNEVMTKLLLATFSAAILIMAAAATYNFEANPSRPVVTQNPLPACPPFCDAPNNGGGETAKRR